MKQLTKQYFIDNMDCEWCKGEEYYTARIFLLLMEKYPSDYLESFDWVEDPAIAFEKFHKSFRQTDVFDYKDGGSTLDNTMWLLINSSNVPYKVMKFITRLLKDDL